MPKVWDLPLEEAKALLDAAGIRYRVSESQNLTVPEGELFSVSPPPGTPLADGLEAILNVSYGQPTRPN
jgi:beta-lactam-binding protein with PASTA domain